MSRCTVNESDIATQPYKNALLPPNPQPLLKHTRPGHYSTKVLQGDAFPKTLPTIRF